MNKLGLVFGLVLCGLGGGVAAQQKGAEALQQAILREESERDDTAAARMYRVVAEDAAADPDVRVQAFERLVRLSRRTGAYERDKVELERLAVQVGEPAMAVLARVGSQTKELEEHARGLVEGWQQHPSPPELLKTLMLIGQPAVPALAAEAEKLGVGRNQWPIMVIGKIGGERADAFLERVAQSPDVLYRRGVLSVVSELDHDSKASLRPFLKRFLRDPDEQVRFSAVSWVASSLDLREQLPLLLDPSERISQQFWLNWDSATREDVGVAMQQLREMLETNNVTQQRAALFQWSGVVRGGWFAHLPYTMFVLDCLPTLHAHRDWARERLNPGWDELLDKRKGFHPLDAESVLQKAELFGIVAADREPPPIAAGVLLNLLETSLRTWTAESIPSVLRLAELGYDRLELADERGRLSWWLAEKVMSNHAAEVLSKLSHLAVPAPVIERLNSVGWGTVDPTELVRMLGSSAVRDDDRQRAAAVGALLLIGSEQADLAVVDAARSDGRVLVDVSEAAWRYRIGRARLLGPLLSASPDSGGQQARDRIFLRIAEEGIAELIEVLPRAYSVGLPGGEFEYAYHRRSGTDWEKVKGVGGIGHLVACSNDGQRFSTYDAESVARIFEQCAATDAPLFWEHAASRIGFAPRIGQPLVSWYASRIDRFARVSPDIGAAVVSMVLGSSKLEAERAALLKWSFGLGPSQAATAALRQLTLTESNERYIQTALLSEDIETVQCAVRLLVHERRDASLYDWLSGLARHRSGIVRETLAEQVASVPDRRWIPILLDLLRDPSDYVRKAAQESLEKMQFYFDTVDRWERWQKGTTLDSPNAAEALLAQAAPDQPKPKRLAAITSLGTLGVPETLPLLIEWMNDADPEIAKAASDAVTRINERKR